MGFIFDVGETVRFHVCSPWGVEYEHRVFDSWRTFLHDDVWWPLAHPNTHMNTEKRDMDCDDALRDMEHGVFDSRLSTGYLLPTHVVGREARSSVEGSFIWCGLGESPLWVPEYHLTSKLCEATDIWTEASDTHWVEHPCVRDECPGCDCCCDWDEGLKKNPKWDAAPEWEYDDETRLDEDEEPTVKQFLGDWVKKTEVWYRAGSFSENDGNRALEYWARWQKDMNARYGEWRQTKIRWRVKIRKEGEYGRA